MKTIWDNIVILAKNKGFHAALVGALLFWLSTKLVDIFGYHSTVGTGLGIFWGAILVGLILAFTPLGNPIKRFIAARKKK